MCASDKRIYRSDEEEKKRKEEESQQLVK